MSITLAFGYRLRHFSSRAPRRQKAGAWLPLEGSLRLRSSGRVGDGRAVSVCALRWYVHIAVRRVMSASPTNSHGSRPRASIHNEGAQTPRRDRQPCGPRGVEGRGTRTRPRRPASGPCTGPRARSPRAITPGAFLEGCLSPNKLGFLRGIHMRKCQARVILCTTVLGGS